MGQPVKLSDKLVSEARSTAALSERSIAGQIEFWAQLGRALEPILRGDQALALKAGNAERSLPDAFSLVDTPTGRQRVQDYLRTRGFPNFEAVEGRPELLWKIDEDGTRTIGRFVDRVFQPVEPYIDPIAAGCLRSR